MRDVFEELFGAWKSQSALAKAITFLMTFLAFSSLASLADVIADWKGFILTGIEFYRSVVTKPIGSVAAVFLGESWNRPEVWDVGLYLSLTAGSICLAEFQLVGALMRTPFSEEDRDYHLRMRLLPIGNRRKAVMRRIYGLAFISFSLFAAVGFGDLVLDVVINAVVVICLLLIGAMYLSSLMLAISIIKLCRPNELHWTSNISVVYSIYAVNMVVRPMTVVLGVGILAAINAGLTG